MTHKNLISRTYFTNKTKGRQWSDPSPKEIHYVLARCPDWFMYQCNGCQIQDTTWSRKKTLPRNVDYGPLFTKSSKSSQPGHEPLVW